MRKLLVSLAAAGLAILTVPAATFGAATITGFKAKAVPIPKPGGGVYRHTGNCLGCGAAVEAEYTLAGSGYGATPQNPNGGIPPISQVNFYLPAGARLHAQGFAACSEATLRNIGPRGCPRRSVASPLGSVLGEVTFGTTRVPEETSLQGFFGPGNGLLFFTHGSSPVNLERLARYSGRLRRP